MQPRVRALFGNAALALGSTLLALLAVELGLRLLPERPTKNRLDLYTRFDPLLGPAQIIEPELQERLAGFGLSIGAFEKLRWIGNAQGDANPWE